MTSKRFDTHDPEGGFEKMRLPENREKRKNNRIRDMASEVGREPEGERVVVPGDLVDQVGQMVQARLRRQAKKKEVPMVVSPETRYKGVKRAILKRDGRVDGNKPERLLVHRIMADVSPGGGVEITKPDDNRMDKWKP